MAMNDFDTVLERLLVDPAFKAVLAADPAAALAGYRLSAEELELLGAQVSTEDGADRTVEMRSSKSSMFGLLSPIEGLVAGSGGGGYPAGEAFSPAGHHTGSAFQQLGDRLGPALNAPGAAEAAPTGTGLPGGAAEGLPLPGAAESVPLAGAGESPLTMGGAQGALPTGEVFGGGDHIPVGYHPHVDADGDGRWDQYVAVQHSDGSVDIYVDRNKDGLVDFVGHDRNADGIIDSADYDENFDGVADTHMTDVNGDGWMDTRTPIPPPSTS
jgi:hypothetical protein